MKKFRNTAVILVIICFVVIIASCTYYNINIGKVSNDSTLKEITIEAGGINGIATTLKDNNLIKNKTIFKVYVKLTGKTNLKAGVYELSENMGTKKIVSILEEGSKISPGEVQITFKEGINIREIARLIEDSTNNSYESVLTLMEDANYIDSLISKYWFLTEDIKNPNIYYPLEGYLYPNTYRFTDKDVSVGDIFTKMLDETDKQLSKYKEDITKSKYNVHELMTLSSIVEKEVANGNDRKAVAGVFYNRLNSSSFPTLGSDATTYYACKIDDWSQILSSKELNNCNNGYNTRCSSNGGIPVGPICNPSIDSFEASINPEDHDYYYFVNDCSGKLYLTKNEKEHNNTINKLKKDNNWCT